jgi:chromosome segregation ATPase
MNPEAVDSSFPQKINGQAQQEAAVAGIAATTVAAAIAIDSVQIQNHVKAINALAVKLAHAEAKVGQYRTAIGQHLKAVKEARPGDWEDIVRTECNLGRSRAYELLAIANGTKTDAEIASATTERSKKRRERLSVAQRTQDSVGDPEASATEMRTKVAAVETVAPSKTTRQHEPEAADAEPEVAREHDKGSVEELRVAQIRIADLENEIEELRDANAALRIENNALREKLAGRLVIKPDTTGWRKWSQKKAADMILQLQRWNYANPNDLCDLSTMTKIRDFHRLRPKLTELFAA